MPNGRVNPAGHEKSALLVYGAHVVDASHPLGDYDAGLGSANQVVSTFRTPHRFQQCTCSLQSTDVDANAFFTLNSLNCQRHALDTRNAVNPCSFMYGCLLVY